VEIGPVKFLADRWLTLCFLLVAGLMLWASFGLSRVSGAIPRVVLSATCLLLLLQLVLDLRSGRSQERADGASEQRSREQVAFSWIVALLLGTWLTGVVAGSALFCLAWMRWHARETWLLAFALAVAVGGLLWLVFGRLPGSGMYAGLVGGLFS